MCRLKGQKPIQKIIYCSSHYCHEHRRSVAVHKTKGKCPYPITRRVKSLCFWWTFSLSCQTHKVTPLSSLQLSGTLNFFLTLPSQLKQTFAGSYNLRKKLQSVSVINSMGSCLGGSASTHDSALPKSWDWLSHLFLLSFPKHVLPSFPFSLLRSKAFRCQITRPLHLRVVAASSLPAGVTSCTWPLARTPVGYRS